MERRREFIDLLELRIGNLDDIGRGLVELVKQCLHNAPRNRPKTSDLHTKMMREVVHLETVRIVVATAYPMNMHVSSPFKKEY